MDTVWLSPEDLTYLLREHLGELYVTRRELLEGAFNAPRNAHIYGYEDDPYALAAVYAARVAAAHALADGNKRLAAVACLMFLEVNHIEPTVDSVVLADAICQIAAGSIGIREFADILRPKIK